MTKIREGILQKRINAKSRMVSSCFWTDPWVVEELEPTQKLLFLYLITNEHANIAGVYEIATKTMADETGLTCEQVKKSLGDFEFAGKARYVENWLILRNTLKHQKNESEDVQKGIQRILESIPEPIQQIVKAFRSTPSIDHPQTIPTPSIDSPRPPDILNSNLTKPNSNSLVPKKALESSKKTAPPALPPAPAEKGYRESLKSQLLKAEEGQDHAAVLMAGMELMQGIPFANYAKEWVSARQVVKKIHTVGRGNDKMRLLRSLLAAYQHKRKSSRQEFWRESPLTPSALNSRFDQLIGFAQKEHENAKLDEISLEALRTTP